MDLFIVPFSSLFANFFSGKKVNDDVPRCSYLSIFYAQILPPAAATFSKYNYFVLPTA